MPHFTKHYTQAEANALLPELIALIREIQSLREKLGEDYEAMRPILQAAHLNGGGPAAHQYFADVKALNQRIHQFQDFGIQLKDLEKGLIDFPAWRGDQEVFLCWRLGEESVQFWHSLEAGFAGRQPL